MLETKNYIVLQKTATTEPTPHSLIWFLFKTSTESNQITYFSILQFR